ncbi:CU044_5270 family protein [Streptomyces sp. 150FB]|uniref:CU044_5270 family protein n=1 Tax=Streptomyces sp. 150FB TaxID=1576605 RepID=UPI0007C6BF72|nr:CU044_5270 family protein [Streptomyces sp. 150FB]
MNEIRETRALRGDCPLPDADQLAPSRARMLRAALEESGGRRNVPRSGASSGRLPRRRMILIPAAAALAVVGGVIAHQPGNTAARQPGSTGDGGPRVLSAAASAQALELAAATVENTGATEPGPKQWVYEKSTVFMQGKPQTSEQWDRWDGTGSATLPGVAPAGDAKDFDPNKLHVWYGPNQEEKWKKEGYDDRSQRQFYRFLSTLPSDPEAMMRRVREEHAIGDVKGETRAERDWRELSVLYRSVLIPPKVRAAMFRAMADIPGTHVEKDVKDPLGRKAIAVTVNYAEPTPSGWQGKQEIFFDPHTYMYLGEKDHGGSVKGVTVPTGKKGTAAPGNAKAIQADHAIVTARVAWGVVNKPGARD